MSILQEFENLKTQIVTAEKEIHTLQVKKDGVEEDMKKMFEELKVQNLEEAKKKVKLMRSKLLDATSVIREEAKKLGLVDG